MLAPNLETVRDALERLDDSDPQALVKLTQLLQAVLEEIGSFSECRWSGPLAMATWPAAERAERLARQIRAEVGNLPRRPGVV